MTNDGWQMDDKRDLVLSKGLIHVGKVPATNGDAINRNEAANRWQNGMTAVINVDSVAR